MTTNRFSVRSLKNDTKINVVDNRLNLCYNKL